MAIANYFYNETTRKYVAIFGTYFNQLKIKRTIDATTEQEMIVPISYAPFQKILARITQDAELDRPASITLPRMSFELNSMSYDGERKINNTMKIRKSTIEEGAIGRGFVYAGVPYNLEFSLYIMTKYSEDAAKIMEQIVPFFNPEFTSTVKLLDNLDPIDIPLVLNNVSTEEVYEGDFTERQSVLYTLGFTMKAWYFGPNRTKPMIKFVDVKVTQNTSPTADIDQVYQERYTTQPGLTANGAPTVDINETIPFTEIDFDDDWGVINLTEVNIS